MKLLPIACGAMSLFAASCEKTAGTMPQASFALRFTNGEQGRKFTKETRHIDRPFQLTPQGVNGTGLIFKYLQDLQVSGATFVSGLQLSLQMRLNGVPIECVTKIVVEDGSAPPAVAEVDRAPEAPGEVEYETTVKPWQPPIENAWVVDRDLVCADHAKQVVLYEPRYENRYNAEIGNYIPPGAMAIDEKATIVHYESCTYTPTRRFVRRYDHFVAARFTPPDLEAVRKRYSDWKLTEAPPVCHGIAVADGAHLRNHIEADAHYSGTFDRISEPEVTLYPYRKTNEKPGGPLAPPSPLP